MSELPKVNIYCARRKPKGELGVVMNIESITTGWEQSHDIRFNVRTGVSSHDFESWHLKQIDIIPVQEYIFLNGSIQVLFMVSFSRMTAQGILPIHQLSYDQLINLKA